MSGSVAVATVERPKVAESREACEVDMWFHECANTAAWQVTRHDCPRRRFGHWRAKRMFKRVGSDRIIRPGGKEFRACAECRAELQTMFALGPIHCWGCLRIFGTYDEYYPAEVEL